MNSKINGVGGGPPRLDGSKPAAPARTNRSESAPQAASADAVSLTDSAQLLVRLEKAIEDVPVIDRERVETIKSAIADGSYAVNAERVATEVLRMETALKLI